MKTRSSRREFLSQMGLAGAGLAAASAFSLPGYGQARGRTARATLGLVAPRADFNRRLFGAFLEHLGRSIYTGVYDPGNPLSDARGFRTDAIREVVLRPQSGLCRRPSRRSSMFMAPERALL